MYSSLCQSSTIPNKVFEVKHLDCETKIEVKLLRKIALESTGIVRKAMVWGSLFGCFMSTLKDPGKVRMSGNVAVA